MKSKFGDVNANGQKLIATTGLPSTTFPGQKIYKMQCTICGNEYGANGCDVHHRTCPRCNPKNAAGEPLT